MVKWVMWGEIGEVDMLDSCGSGSDVSEKNVVDIMGMV